MPQLKAYARDGKGILCLPPNWRMILGRSSIRRLGIEDSNGGRQSVLIEGYYPNERCHLLIFMRPSEGVARLPCRKWPAGSGSSWLLQTLLR